MVKRSLVSLPLRVVFLWHFHQPWYVDLANATARLPWVRLHALKDYGDLPALLAEEPRVPHAANLVPSLLDQIALLASGASDTFLDVARRPVSEWDEADVSFALNNFFSAHPQMTRNYPRYAELQDRRKRWGSARTSVIGRTFSPADLRDLVVLFHLAWSGPTLQTDPLLVKLRKHGRGFTEEDKNALLDRQAAFLNDVLPAWKRAFASGVVEATTSPYHHPILPLLVTSEAGREVLRDLPLPALRFARPEDARAQLALGLATFEKHFGFRPKGMWPPEGAISEAALSLMAEAGVAWVASDEQVLLQSLPGGGKSFGEGDKARNVFRPWRLSSKSSPAIFFRDRVLSDRIGFSYASWSAEDAAKDFVERLLAIRTAAPEADLAVPVILDGENAWETYPENGVLFLRALARALAACKDIRVQTPSAALAEMPAAPLERLVAGSWVNGSLATWIGAPAKNRAWELLAKARETLASEIGSAPAVPPTEVLAGSATGPAAAKASLFAAEASDWFWWFGDDHSSAHDAVFDAMFRHHVAAAYRALGRNVPAELDEPVDVRIAPEPVLTTTPISPVINGAMPDYFEWLGAGHVTPQARGAMSRGAGLLRDVHFGADSGGTSFFLRVDPVTLPASESLAGRTLRVFVQQPDGGAPVQHDLPLPLHPDAEACHVGVHVGVDRIVEARLPRPEGAPEDPVVFRVVLLGPDGNELEAIPVDGWVRFRTVTSDWSA
jgi:alpha-amylase/alpha-mannosidase (GH57 family)